MIILNDYFDAIYYINLAHRTDRNLAFLSHSKHLNHANIIRFEALYGKDLAIAKWPGTSGALGVRQSHINVLKNAQQLNYKKFIVFEDDVIIKKGFDKKVQKILQELGDDWDMIYLYAEVHVIKPIPVSNNINKLQNTLGLVAVAYNARNLNVIISKLENDLRWVDSCMGDMHQALKVYAPAKSIVSHMAGFSDNEGMIVNYNSSPITNFFNTIIYKFNKKIRKIIFSLRFANNSIDGQ